MSSTYCILYSQCTDYSHIHISKEYRHITSDFDNDLQTNIKQKVLRHHNYELVSVVSKYNVQESTQLTKKVEKKQTKKTTKKTGIFPLQ